MVDLHTTNVLLGIMAAVSVLEALMLIGAAFAGFIAYRRAMQVVGDLERQQIAPLRRKVDAILADVQAITARVSQQSERVDQAITGTFDRVDETADRMRSSMRDKVYQAVGVVRGVRAAIMSVLQQA
jgi:hypothetical protein